MTIEAELADGRILEFPDGTKPEVIQGVVKKLIGGGAPAPAAPAKEAGFFETVGANAGAGLVNAGLGAAAALTDYTGFHDTAASLDAKRKAVEEWQKEHGGETFTGKVASTVGALAPNLISGGAGIAINIAGNVIPGFRDTYNAQREAGASKLEALEHAAAEAGFMLVGGKLIRSGTKVLPQSVQKAVGETLLPSVANKTAGKLATAGAEGAVFSGADIGTHAAIDALNGRQTKDRSAGEIAEDIATNALGFAALGGAHHVLNAPKEVATTPPPTGTPAGTTATPPPAGAKPVDTSAREAELQAQGVSGSLAQRIAAKEAADKAKAAAVPPPVPTPDQVPAEKKGPVVPQDMSKLSAWPDAMLTSTLAFQEAKAAPKKPLVDAIKAELQRRAEIKGAENVAGTEPPPSRESVSMAGEPGVGTAAGPETPARDGMVPTEPNVGLPATGEAPKPAALEEIKPPVVEEGKPSGTETVEAKQAEPQEQEAPAAVVDEKGAFIPSGKKGEDPIATAGFKVLGEDNNLSEKLAGATLITGMDTTKEGQGTGSKLLKAITDWADANGKKLALVPAAAPKGELGLSQEQLKEWYARNGFEDRTDFMVREPGGKKTEAPAAPKPPKAPKPGKEVHTVAQGAEGKWSHAINGEVAGTYDTKRQATAASLLEKAKKNGNADLIAQRQKVFDDAMNPQQRGRPPKIIPFEPTTAETEKAAPAEEVKPEAPAEEAAPEVDAQEKMDADMAAYEASKAKVEGIARDNAQGAFDHVGEYDGDIDAAVDSHRQNTYDTLVEEGLKKDPRYDRLLDAADRAFDAEVAKLKAKAEEKTKTETAAKAKTEQEKNLTLEERERLAELDDLHNNATNNPNTEGGKAAKKTLERITKDFDEPKVVRERAKQMLSGEYPATHGVQAAQGKQDPAFSKFTTSSETLSHIVKTGTPFQKKLAQRLRSTVRNVKMVVVEKGQELPATLAAAKSKWDRCLALYSSENKGVVYTKGESYGKNNGLNAVVQLHELFHGATSQKIRTALAYLEMGRHLDSQMVKAIEGLQKTMDAAREELNRQIADGTADPDVHSLAVYGEALTNLHEFVSYGNTDAKLQKFLMGVQGFEKNTNLFSPFVDALRRMIGMGKEDATALSDLIQHTDQLISSRRPGGWGFSEEGTHASAIPPTQEELNKAVDESTQKVKTSRDGNELGKATSNLASLRDPRNLWGEIKGIWGSLTYDARSRLSHFYDSEGIAYGGPGDVISGLKDAHESIQKLTGSKQTYLRGVANMTDKIVDFFRAEPDKRQAFEDLVNESTVTKVNGKFGYDPSDTSKTVRNEKLDKDYEALGEQGQKLYTDLRDYYKTLNDTQRFLLEERIGKLDLPEAARNKLLDDIRLTYEKDAVEPYFHLARFGDFTLETGKRGEHATYRFDTLMQRDRAAREYAAQQGRSLDELRQDGLLRLKNDVGGAGMRLEVEGASRLLKDSYAAIDSSNMADPKAKQQLKDELYQAYLGAMPENSVRKLFVHRKGTPGFSSDVLRAVNSFGSKSASALASLEHSSDIRQAMEKSTRQLEGNEELTPFVRRMNEFASAAIEPKPTTDVDKFFNSAAGFITKISFIRNLTSYASAIMQPMDVILKGAPVLTGNHGAKAMAELSRMANIFGQYGVVEKMPDGTERYRAPSIEFAKGSGITPAEKKAIREMVDVYGITKETLANDVFSRAKKPSTKVDSKAMEMGKTALDNLVLGGLMHHGERLSREIIALTSFRLHLAEMEKASPGNPLNYHEAVKAAVRETNEVLGNYNANNKPMMMRGATGKLLSMYKFFPFLTTKMLVGNFFKMLPMMNKEGKKAAAIKFFGVLGTHALLGGVVALPAFSLVMNAMQSAWKAWQKDPDAPDDMRDLDFETWWRTEYLPSVFGNTDMSRLVEYGLLNKLTGWDLSSRLSLNDMWFRDPKPGKNLTDTFMNWGQVVGGPAATTALSFAQGVQLISQGEYEKGFEKLAPASISKAMMAHRYATQGVQTSQGTQLVEPGKMPTSEIVGQAIGYAPAQVAEAQNIIFKSKAAEQAVTRERQQIMNSVADLYNKSMDPSLPQHQQERFDEKFQDALDKSTEFSFRYPQLNITPDEISKAIENSTKRKAETEIGAGVRLTPKNVTYLDASQAAAENALAKYNK